MALVPFMDLTCDLDGDQQRKVVHLMVDGLAELGIIPVVLGH